MRMLYYLSFSWLFKSQDMFVWQGGKGRGGNFLDGGSAFYDTYRTKDDKFMAVGALEPHFFAKMSNILSEQGCLETGQPHHLKACSNKLDWSIWR